MITKFLQRFQELKQQSASLSQESVKELLQFVDPKHPVIAKILKPLASSSNSTT
jgi:hypothetical protein